MSYYALKRGMEFSNISYCSKVNTYNLYCCSPEISQYKTVTRKMNEAGDDENVRVNGKVHECIPE